MTPNETIQLVDIAIEMVLERSLLEGISPTISGTIVPQVAEYEKLKIEMKATRHLLAALLPGAATETIANVSMQIAFMDPPTRINNRRSNQPTSQKVQMEPAVEQA